MSRTSRSSSGETSVYASPVASARAVLEFAGVSDILTKAIGSTNPINLVRATMDGLTKLRAREETERLRGVSIV